MRKNNEVVPECALDKYESGNKDGDADVMTDDDNETGFVIKETERRKRNNGLSKKLGKIKKLNQPHNYPLISALGTSAVNSVGKNF
jgi:hypothetical protein